MFTKLKESISTFMTWWKDGLAYLVPQRIRQYLLGIQDPVILKITPPVAEAGIINDDGKFIVKQSLNFDDSDIVDTSSDNWIVKMCRKHYPLIVQVAERMGLRTQVTVPLSARKDLSKIIHFEIERKTPFSSDEVLYSYKIMNIDKESGRIKVWLHIIPYEFANKILKWMDRRHLKPDMLMLESAHAESIFDMQEADLLPPDRMSRKFSASSRLNAVLVLCILALSAVALYLPAFHQKAEIARLQGAHDKLSHDAEQVEKLRNTYDRLLSENKFLLAKKKESYPAVEVINRISALFPDDTYLSRLELIDKKVNLHGESGNASSLIRMLEDDEMFYNVEFKAPVTRTNSSGNSRFHIAAELSGPAQ